MPYTPHTDEEKKQMLKVIGAQSTDDLFRSIPEALRASGDLKLPGPMGQMDLIRHLEDLASKNSVEGTLSFLGAGVYRHFSPPAVAELAMRSEFLTPYTPYQPEISQGTLQVTFEFQSMISRLFDMEVANASLYDGSTALTEAVLMALRIGKTRNTILLCDAVHPEYREVLETIAGHNGAELLTLPAEDGVFNRAALKDHINDNVAAVVVQFSNFFGIVEDLADVSELVHRAGGLMIAVVPEPVALGLFNPPGTWGADIAVGEGLSFGLPIGFGGPALGLFACRQHYLRNMPGRLCGETVDADGQRGYVLTMSTREQHIRREKATSNICTNQTHCAIWATIWMALLGKKGFAELATVNAARAHYARQQCRGLPGVKLRFDRSTFNEFVIELPKPAESILEAMRNQGIHGGVALGRWYPQLTHCLLVCVTELHTKKEIDRYVETLKTSL